MQEQSSSDTALLRLLDVLIAGGDGKVAGSDGGSCDEEKSVCDVVDQRRSVRTAAPQVEQRQRLPQRSLGEDDQHLSALQSRQRTRLLQGASNTFESS